MHDSIYHVLVVCHAVAITLLVVWAARAGERGSYGDVFRPALALDAVAPVVIGLLALVAVHTGEASYLDIALVVALLSFAQTVGVARLVERRRGGSDG